MKRKILFYITLLFPLMGYSQEVKNIDSLTMVGAMNAVRKAHQMTDLPIIPMATLYANEKKTYKTGKKYKGVIYSSVKEINTYIGQDVSFHTFMTALHNPRSVLYTERLDKLPYHGNNCIAYYGTVCSGLINYALGFKVTQRSGDILVEDYFQLVDNQSAKGIRIADLVCRKGHPALITGIEKDGKGNIVRIEVCSARTSGCCRRYYNSEEEFNEWLKKDNIKIYRYRDLYKNTSYVPVNDFVAVDGEKLLPFTYNDAICANKGDKSCYVTGEDVTLNVFEGGDKVEIYKDSKFYKEILINHRDTNLILKKYPYGDYQARVVTGNKKSDYTRWKVIDVNVRIDKEKNRIYFSSANATPVYYEFCTVSGSRHANGKRIYAAEFIEEQIKNGFVTVMAPKAPTKGNLGCSFVKVHFECDYGMVINKPVNWFK